MRLHDATTTARSANVPLTWRWVYPALACVAMVVGGTVASTSARAQSSNDATPSGTTPPVASTQVEAVPELDVDRYMGTWFEIAKFPNYFQRKCASDTQATYSKRSDGGIDVLNSCKASDGTVEAVHGLARPDTMAPILPSKLQVRFAPAWLGWLPFVWGRYWVVLLDPDYRYAVVSEPRRKYLWILSRNAQMSPAQYDDIVKRIGAMGFDTSRLVRSEQNPATSAPRNPAPSTNQ